MRRVADETEDDAGDACLTWQLNHFTGHVSALPYLSRWFDLISAVPEIAAAHNKVRHPLLRYGH